MEYANTDSALVNFNIETKQNKKINHYIFFVIPFNWVYPVYR